MASTPTPNPQTWLDKLEALFDKAAGGGLSEVEQLVLDMVIKLLEKIQ